MPAWQHGRGGAAPRAAQPPQASPSPARGRRGTPGTGAREPTQNNLYKTQLRIKGSLNGSRNTAEHLKVILRVT